MLISACWESLVVVGLTISDIICSVDNEVSCIDVIALASSLEELRVMDNAWFFEVKLLVLF